MEGENDEFLRKIQRMKEVTIWTQNQLTDLESNILQRNKKDFNQFSNKENLNVNIDISDCVPSNPSENINASKPHHFIPTNQIYDSKKYELYEEIYHRSRKHLKVFKKKCDNILKQNNYFSKDDMKPNKNYYDYSNNESSTFNNEDNNHKNHQPKFSKNISLNDNSSDFSNEINNHNNFNFNNDMNYQNYPNFNYNDNIEFYKRCTLNFNNNDNNSLSQTSYGSSNNNIISPDTSDSIDDLDFLRNKSSKRKKLEIRNIKKKKSCSLSKDSFDSSSSHTKSSDHSTFLSTSSSTLSAFDSYSKLSEFYK